MKKIAIIASIGLTFAAAGTLTAGLISSNKNETMNSQVQASSETATVYFNLSAFGPTYTENEQVKNTSFSVSAWSDTTADQTWYDVTPVDLSNSIFSITAPVTTKNFIVLRAAEGVKNKWTSEGAWNQSGTVVRSDVTYDYCWLYDDGGYCNKGSWKQTAIGKLNVNGTPRNMSFNFLNNQYYLTEVELTTSDAITISKGETTFGYSHLEAGCKALFNEGASNAFSAKNGSLYAFYLKEDNGGTIWAQIDSGVEAATWAEGFVKGVGCAAPYNAAPKNWDTYAGTFATLTDGAKDTLIGATASNEEGATYVQQAAFIHDMCVRKYAGCDVFMKRDGGGSRTVTPSNSINLVENNGNNYTAIIIIVASVAVVSLSAAFIMLKKRKESR